MKGNNNKVEESNWKQVSNGRFDNSNIKVDYRLELKGRNDQTR